MVFDPLQAMALPFHGPDQPLIRSVLGDLHSERGKVSKVVLEINEWGPEEIEVGLQLAVRTELRLPRWERQHLTAGSAVADAVVSNLLILAKDDVGMSGSAVVEARAS